MSKTLTTYIKNIDIYIEKVAVKKREKSHKSGTIPPKSGCLVTLDILNTNFPFTTRLYP